MNFEWDENKRISNLEKHFLDFIDAQSMFDGREVYTYLSSYKAEKRFVTIGMIENIALAVIWTERADAMRIISFRRARDEEKRTYHALFSH